MWCLSKSKAAGEEDATGQRLPGTSPIHARDDEVATRLFALTEPEGYLRVYLDEGEPMRQALLAWLTSHSQQYQQPSSTTVYVSQLLAVFEQEANGASRSQEAATTPEPSLVQPSSPASSALVASLTRREQEVLYAFPMIETTRSRKETDALPYSHEGTA